MRVRRLRKHPAALEVTAFISLIVVLVPFLLSTAVFTRLSVLDVALPAQTSGVEQLKVDDLKLEIVIRPDALEVGDRIGGLIQRIPDTAGGHDLKTLAAVMYRIKQRFPTETDATVMAQPNTSYDVLVQVMDAVRATYTANGIELVRTDLFPAISIGDAPVVKR
ncbi:biopolymer transporter ExbD [Caldimonas brevitalea]|uniref:Biopolymer transporter ExbD n=1 Tax=Caldimonas brevitalea TaxID=413882 RepID=A0A0G3BIM0_9BURK|nr:biopolymer transporter ExbD [Caldimonas brevitalea]AKJ29237.1 biopolymer transporter ExbD [Caldimonas brevitalea]